MITPDNAKKWAGSIDWKALIIGLLVAGLLWSLWHHGGSGEREIINAVNAMQDTLRVYHDRTGARVSEIGQIRTSDPRVFVSLKSDNPEIKRLQAEVQTLKGQLANGGSVTQFASSTHVNATLDATGADTDQKWYAIKVNDGRATVDVRNEYTVSVVEDGGSALVRVKNLNPYSTEAEVRTYATMPRERKRWGIGPYVGYDASRGVSGGVAVSWQVMQW